MERFELPAIRSQSGDSTRLSYILSLTRLSKILTTANYVAPIGCISRSMLLHPRDTIMPRFYSITTIDRLSILPSLILTSLPTFQRGLLWSCHIVTTFHASVKIPPAGFEPAPRRLKGVCASSYATEVYCVVGGCAITPKGSPSPSSQASSPSSSKPIAII